MYKVGDKIRFKDNDGTVRIATVIKVENYWVYIDLKDEDGNPFMFKDIEGLLGLDK